MKHLSKIILLFCLLIDPYQAWAKEGEGHPLQNYRSFYVVPVSDSHLLKFAIFSYVKVEYKNLPNNRVQVQYSLPLELTGVENKVELMGTRNEGGRLLLSGNGCSADCTTSEGFLRCEMIYKNIIFNPEIRHQILDTISRGNRQELQKRTFVAEEFQRLVTESQETEMTQAQSFHLASNNGALLMRGDSEIHGILEVIIN